MVAGHGLDHLDRAQSMGHAHRRGISCARRGYCRRGCTSRGRVHASFHRRATSDAHDWSHLRLPTRHPKRLCQVAMFARAGHSLLHARHFAHSFIEKHAKKNQIPPMLFCHGGCLASSCLFAWLPRRQDYNGPRVGPKKELACSLGCLSQGRLFLSSLLFFCLSLPTSSSVRS